MPGITTFLCFEELQRSIAHAHCSYCCRDGPTCKGDFKILSTPMIGLVAPVAWLFKHHYCKAAAPAETILILCLFKVLLCLIYTVHSLPDIVNIRNVVEGKRAAKQALQQKLGPRTADLPLVSIITCLTHQKRMHPIKHGIWHNLCSNIQVSFYLTFSKI
ncbi:hypothetical protein FEM48_Zijuj01G0125900 [Ziziphus jujuba var. spinosa]|uniref:starch synthase n=1 Tax=Ziziphus jujuba var. spinosa TaxID=714518 RepID=A0A978W1A6_ZIZJJ|nr:hypothetical protein FEM48_Zijuj01G0125900 [Ziziphus jujuba var. spinosa]